MSIPLSYNVQIEFDIPATMRDGTILRANIFRPVASGPFPVLLTRLPYGKDLPLGNSVINAYEAARRGYIVVVQDVRGRFASEGEWHAFLAERPDGYDSVEWAAQLPGSDGTVGMFGASYFGFTQLAAARERPPHLRALAPFITWARTEDGPVFRGGALELGLGRHWSQINALDTSLRRTRPTGDPRQIIGGIMRLAAELDALPERGYADLPVKGFSTRRDDDALNDIDAAIDQRADASYLDIASAANSYDALAQYPALHIGGWYDIFLNGTLQNYTELTARGQAPQKLLIGPWSHTAQDERVGSVAFGFGASAGLINLQTDLHSLQLRWFDRFLKADPNGIDTEAPVQIFVMGINQWRAENAWPLARAVPTPWYLHSGGAANGVAGDGTLSPEAPGTEPNDTYAYDPMNPVPTVGGAFLMHPLFQNGPQDQRPIERRSDVLVFTSAPLTADTEVTGPITVTLFAATDAPDTDFVARLVDVHPNGFARNLTDGIIRGRFRNGFAQEQLLTPGEITQFTLDLWATSNVFRAGHRIRLDITSSNFPRWDRNLNTDAPYGEGTESAVATQTIVHDRTHPSHVVLPIVPQS
ncbi:MAG: CocE/NonD family hydrolase [Ktedonobacterales bacterium]|nr:CocE/NonD family hydrolase [Ktedonobacterales bacterium]